MTTPELRQFTLSYPDGFEETVFFRSDATPDSLRSAADELHKTADRQVMARDKKPTASRPSDDGESTPEDAGVSESRPAGETDSVPAVDVERIETGDVADVGQVLGEAGDQVDQDQARDPVTPTRRKAARRRRSPTKPAAK